jgi:hypothetical protein
MKRIFLFLFLFSFGAINGLNSQQVAKVDKVAFFQDETTLDVTVITNMKTLMNKKMKQGFVFPAVFRCRIGDQDIEERIQMEARGNNRRETCYMPPLKLKFNNESSPTLSSLKTLKLVNPCDLSTTYNEYLLKEYLCYKIYNQLTDMSLRTRLLKITYIDSASKKTFLTSHSFLIEDINDLAKRNNCVEVKRFVPHTDATNRQHTALVCIFQYMIGNTDWAIPVDHNIKLIAPKGDTTALPFAVPYDFDLCGLVNANYAVPNPILPIVSVKDRLYRGFPRTIEELQPTVALFNNKKDAIIDLINNFEMLPVNRRKDMINYLRPFFEIMSNQRDIQTEFIRNARVN